MQIGELPAPRKHDFKYFVFIVGPGLRPDNPDDSYTADMCMPIYPNVSHSAGRPPVRPDPDFPFSNCYHWFGPDMELNIRVKNDEYKYGLIAQVPQFTKLPTDQYVDMEMIHHQADVNRILAMLAERKRDAPPEPPNAHSEHGPLFRRDFYELHDDISETSGPGNDEYVAPACYEDALNDTYSLESRPDPCMDQDNGPGGDNTDSLAESTKSVTESDIFDMIYTEERARTPVVSISLDLTEHFKNDDEVPNPMTFLEECAAFSRCVLLWSMLSLVRAGLTLDQRMVTEFRERQEKRKIKREAREHIIQGKLRTVLYLYNVPPELTNPQQ